jgi:AbrB family looped-hinge helix DNA binding protein
VGKTKMDERGRILIPLDEREKLGLKAGTEFELVREDGVLVLRPIIPEPLRVDASHRKWGKEAFLDAGEATFGEQ